METSMRQALSKILMAVDKLAATVVLKPAAKMDFVPTPFFKRWQVIRVTYRGPIKPLLFYLGTQLPEKALVLTGRPEAFAQMANEEAVTLADPGLARDYALTFLETTRSADRRYTMLNSVADIRFLPHPNAEQAARIEALYRKYEPVIVAPQAGRLGDEISVSCYGVAGTDLLQWSLKVKPQGGLAVDSQVLESKLPVPYSL